MKAVADGQSNCDGHNCTEKISGVTYELKIWGMWRIRKAIWHSFKLSLKLIFKHK